MKSREMTEVRRAIRIFIAGEPFLPLVQCTVSNGLIQCGGIKTCFLLCSCECDGVR